MVYQEFRTFLIEKNIFNLMISAIIGTAVSGVVKELIKQFINPITDRLIGEGLKYKVNYFGSQIEFGEIINKIIEFIIIMIVSFGIYKATSTAVAI